MSFNLFSEMEQAATITFSTKYERIMERINTNIRFNIAKQEILLMVQLLLWLVCILYPKNILPLITFPE